MGEVVNLRTRRKARLRSRAAEQAASNRVRFGRTRDERRLAKAVEERSARRLDGHRIESGETS